MPTTAPPILIWQPGGGVAVGPISSGGPVYSQHGTTQLIEGQAYIDVVFGSVQTDDEWVLVECVVVNEIDGEPLNIWPGIITDKTASGFRLQLNGMPDSSNYYLHWAVSGINITPTPATSYLLTGPSSGGLGVAGTFTVALFPSTTIAAPVVVIPSDGGSGGSFSPTFVTLTTGSPSQTFTYTPASYGVRTISVTNSGPLVNPAGIAFNCIVTTYTFSGPGAGTTGVASTNFTVALPVGGVVTGTITVTPSSGGGGGTFTPTTVGLTTAAPSATFTYTPATDGTKTLSVTNNGGLTNPGSISYVASTPPFDPSTIAGLLAWWKADSLVLTDGDPVSTWADSTANAHNATQSGSARPTYKTSIVNGKPVVRFVSTSSQFLNVASPITEPAAWTIFVVMAGVSGKETVSLATVANSGTFGPLLHPSGTRYMGSAGSIQSFGSWSDTVFHVYAGTETPVLFVDGASQSPSFVVGGASVPFDSIGARSGTEYSDGDIAEILIYNSILSGPNRTAVESYLRTKYGTP